MQKTYAKSNKTLSSINAYKRNEFSKKADEYQKAANIKRDSKASAKSKTEKAKEKINNKTVNEVKKSGLVSKGLSLEDHFQKKVTDILGGQNAREAAAASQAIARTWASNRPSTLQKVLYSANTVRKAKKSINGNDAKITINDKDTAATKRVKQDYNNLSNIEFEAKYATTKNKYAKRVEKSKTGDPLKSVKTVGAVALNAAYIKNPNNIMFKNKYNR